MKEENMSDLISREELLKELREIMDEPHNVIFLMGIGAAVSIIEHRETAFDKEKVLDELGELTGEECTLHECGIRSEKCKACIAKKAVEIVDRGGLN